MCSIHFFLFFSFHLLLIFYFIFFNEIKLEFCGEMHSMMETIQAQRAKGIKADGVSAGLATQHPVSSSTQLINQTHMAPILTVVLSLFYF
ncbi:Uncharacterized protein APZ42_020860 [Daphnia magna]|uniref:Uncharacterized protein n=1 Tax=Daphnia magna TaxID=35525 RepID=A0A164XFT0_9CRUS|nr:Uncharacterized protein APZ42_020860 [Daphnia magna]